MSPEELTTDVIRKALGMTGTPAYCPRAASVHLAHKTRKGAGAVARVGCKSWACAGCSGRLRLAYGHALAVHLLNSPAPVRETTTADAEWASLKKRFNRAGADYVRIADRDEWYTVLHNGDTCDRPLNGMQAVTRLGELLLAIRHTATSGRFRPVVTSGGWGLPKRESEYQFAGLVPYAHPEKVRAALEAVGATVWTVVGEAGGWLYAYHTDGPPVDLSKRG